MTQQVSSFNVHSSNLLSSHFNNRLPQERGFLCRSLWNVQTQADTLRAGRHSRLYSRYQLDRRKRELWRRDSTRDGTTYPANCIDSDAGSSKAVSHSAELRVGGLPQPLGYIEFIELSRRRFNHILKKYEFDMRAPSPMFHENIELGVSIRMVCS